MATPVKDANGIEIKVGDKVKVGPFLDEEDPIYTVTRFEDDVVYVEGTDGGGRYEEWFYANDLVFVMIPQERSVSLSTTTGNKPAIDGTGYKTCMDNPKTPVDMIPPQFIEGVADVLLYGANKYSAHNWMRGMDWETVLAAAQRHILAFRRGEEVDPESNLPHLFHAACSLMYAAWYAHGPNAEEYKRFDNRVFKSAGREEK